MKIKRPQQILLALSSLVASAFGLPGLAAPRSIAELDALIAREVSNSSYPGFAVAIVKTVARSSAEATASRTAAAKRQSQPTRRS